MKKLLLLFVLISFVLPGTAFADYVQGRYVLASLSPTSGGFNLLLSFAYNDGTPMLVTPADGGAPVSSYAGFIASPVTNTFGIAVPASLTYDAVRQSFDLTAMNGAVSLSDDSFDYFAILGGRLDYVTLTAGKGVTFSGIDINGYTNPDIKPNSFGFLLAGFDPAKPFNMSMSLALAGTFFIDNWDSFSIRLGAYGYEVSAVPIPGALLLIGTGLGGLAALRRGRRIWR